MGSFHCIILFLVASPLQYGNMLHVFVCLAPPLPILLEIECQCMCIVQVLLVSLCKEVEFGVVAGGVYVCKIKFVFQLLLLGLSVGMESLLGRLICSTHVVICIDQRCMQSYVLCVVCMCILVGGWVWTGLLRFYC